MAKKNIKIPYPLTGFTLIELLVVVSVIGLLSSVVLVSVKYGAQSAKEKKNMQFSSSIQHALSANAIGIYSFEDNLNDSSGQGNDGDWVCGGSPCEGTFVNGIINKAVRIGESTLNNYIHVSLSDKLRFKSGGLTAEFWVKWDVIDSVYRYLLVNVISGVSTGAFPCVFATNGGQLYGYIYDVNGGLAGFRTSDIKTDEWTHIVLTYDGKSGNSAKLYVNSKEYSWYYNTLGVSIREGSSELYIGGYSYTMQNSKGIFDEVRIYDSYISLSEVQKHYAEGLMRIGIAEHNKNNIN